MQTIIKVEGMMCTHCKARVESACKAVPGVTDAVVDLKQKQVAVVEALRLMRRSMNAAVNQPL